MSKVLANGNATNPMPVKASEEFKQPKTFAELLALAPERLEQVDLARINLLCAEGLRGAEDLNVEKTLDTLDRWAQHVQRETLRNHHRFIKHPEKYENSEAYYRMMMLAVVLQEDFRARYAPERAIPQLLGQRESDDVFYADASDVFIHGLLGGVRRGTCSSLPVLYAAVAQRLGYPVNLASTKDHLYLRYEEGDKHLNVDAAGEGFITHTDEEYKKWPFPITEEEIKAYGFLKPMSRREALGAFLTIRAGGLTSAKRYDEAAQSWEAASLYLPPTQVLKRIVEQAKARAGDAQKAARWEKLWDEVVHQPMPEEPKLGYFQDRQARVLLFMNQTTNIGAIEKAVTDLKDEVEKYATAMTTDTHKVKFRISLVPPPVRLLQAPEPNDLLVASDTSPQPARIRIRAERVPHEYWQSVPPELQQRLNALKNEEQIVSEMNSYYAEELNRRNRLAMEQRTAKPVIAQPANPQTQLAQENARRLEEMKVMMVKPFTPGVPNLPLTRPPVRIEIVPPQTGTQ